MRFTKQNINRVLDLVEQSDKSFRDNNIAWYQSNGSLLYDVKDEIATEHLKHTCVKSAIDDIREHIATMYGGN